MDGQYKYEAGYGYNDLYGDYEYGYDDDEEMPATERERAEDAQWKLIQIAMVEVLSENNFTKFNRRPNFRTQKLENVTICLKFLENDEDIRIVNICECFFYVCWELSLQMNRHERA